MLKSILLLPVPVCIHVQYILTASSTCLSMHSNALYLLHVSQENNNRLSVGFPLWNCCNVFFSLLQIIRDMIECIKYSQWMMSDIKSLILHDVLIQHYIVQWCR